MSYPAADAVPAPTAPRSDPAPTPAYRGTPSDEGRFARAIRFLVEHRREQPGLDRVAREAGLSPFHFERRFKRWAGVTPKQFLQYVTLEHAKVLLAEEASVLDASLEVGLSGPSRLHDLFVTVEAVTPGEFKRRGDGVEIAWDTVETPLGTALVAVTERGVCHLGFLADGPGPDPQAAARAGLERAWPGAALHRDGEAVAPVARRLVAQLAGSAGKDPTPVRLHLRGTNFQLQVWRALLRIPHGGAVSYGGLARELGRPGAARAVARAVAANPVAVLIPCHRVIRASGDLAGYRWGRDRKRTLLAWESARAAGQGP